MLQDIRIARIVGSREDDGGIPLASWLQFVEADEELQPLEFVMGRNPRTGSSVRVLLTGGARWTGHPVSEPLPFHWEFGSVVTRGADAHTVGKAQQIATLLSAECHLLVD